MPHRPRPVRSIVILAGLGLGLLAGSLGPAGPVLSALVKTTRNSEAPANASALFQCVADASGKLISVELLESDSDPAPWRRVARRVLAALGAQLLRLPKTGQGASFRIRVQSRQTLPSGADPGLDVVCDGILKASSFVYEGA